jgi:SAM-dependent methyltransferase
MADLSQLDLMLRNEADMAFKRRVKVILEYLDIQSSDRVLDCGCGLGFYLMVIRELYDCRLDGIDYGLARLAKARQEMEGKRVHLAQADISHLPYAAGSFDKILLSEVLEHLPQDGVALNEVKRILKPGGIVAITVPHRDYPFLWDPVNKTREKLALRPIRTGFFGGIWTDHVRLYSPDAISALVTGCGLAIDDLQVFTHYCFPFSHNIVYGIGKPLVESGLLAGADRFRYKENSGSWLNPINLGLRLFNFIDRLNDNLTDKKTYVSISVKARKPG